MRKYGLKSASIVTAFSLIVIAVLVIIGIKGDWNLLIFVAAILFVRIFLVFNLIGVGESGICFYYPINPFKKQQHFILTEIKNVQLINISVYGNSAKIVLITKDDVEWSMQLICFKKELYKLCADLRQKGVEVNTSIYNSF